MGIEANWQAGALSKEAVSAASQLIIAMQGCGPSIVRMSHFFKKFETS